MGAWLAQRSHSLRIGSGGGCRFAAGIPHPSTGPRHGSVLPPNGSGHSLPSNALSCSGPWAYTGTIQLNGDHRPRNLASIVALRPARYAMTTGSRQMSLYTAVSDDGGSGRAGYSPLGAASARRRMIKPEPGAGTALSPRVRPFRRTKMIHPLLLGTITGGPRRPPRLVLTAALLRWLEKSGNGVEASPHGADFIRRRGTHRLSSGRGSLQFPGP